MKTGIVLKQKGEEAVILLNGGELYKTRARKDWNIGDTVVIPPTSLPSYLSMRAAVCAACLAFICLAGIYGKNMYSREYLLISIDINPSIELSVNSFGRVINASARNEEGKLLIESVDVFNKAYQEAMTLLLESDDTNRYLSKERTVTVAVAGEKAAKADQVAGELKSLTDRAVKESKSWAEVECFAVDRALVEAAHGHGITAGKYYYLLLLQEEKPDINMEECSHHTVRQLKEEIRMESASEENTMHHSGSGSNSNHH